MKIVKNQTTVSSGFKIQNKAETSHNATLQRNKAVSAYFTSKQILHSAFAGKNIK